MSRNNEPVVNKKGVMIFNPNVGTSVAQNDEEQNDNETVVNKKGVVVFNPNVGNSVEQNDNEQDESPDHLPPSVFNNRVVFKSNGHALRNFVVKERLIVKDLSLIHI